MLRYLLVIIDDSAKIGGWMVIGSCSWEMPIPGYQSVDVTTSSTYYNDILTVWVNLC